MRTVLITGANRGLGLALAVRFADEGWFVHATYRQGANREQLEAVAQEHSSCFKLHALDITDPQQAHALSTKLADSPIDLLINNAGIWGCPNMALGELASAPWLETFRTNTIAPMILTQALLPSLLKSEMKCIVAISSDMASMTLNDQGSTYYYRSSKAALNANFKSLSCDLKAQGVTVCMVHPGWLKTDMGGPNAPISAEEGAKGVYQLLAKADHGYNGRFIRCDGSDLPW